MDEPGKRGGYHAVALAKADLPASARSIGLRGGFPAGLQPGGQFGLGQTVRFGAFDLAPLIAIGRHRQFFALSLGDLQGKRQFFDRLVPWQTCRAGRGMKNIAAREAEIGRIAARPDRILAVLRHARRQLDVERVAKRFAHAEMPIFGKTAFEVNVDIGLAA